MAAFRPTAAGIPDEFVSHGSHLSTFKREPSLSSLLLAMPVPAHGETPGQRASRNAQGTTTVHAARQERGAPSTARWGKCGMRAAIMLHRWMLSDR